MSEFDFSTLITDRTNADVSVLSTLLSKKLETWTPEELEQFNNGLLKGGYWWTDLNRVTACMEYLDEELRGLGYESGYVPVVVHEPTEPEKPVLPDGYTQLEYIESTGTQWIDTGVVPNQTTRVVIDIKISESQSGQGHICSVAENVFYTLIFNPLDSEWYQTRYGNGEVLRFPSSLNVRDRIQIDKNGRTTTIGDTTLTENEYGFQCSESLPLLCRKSNGVVDMLLSAKVYSAQIYNYGKIVRNYFPTKSSSAVGLYDTVTSEFYKSSGSGEFIAGPEIVQEQQPEPLDPYTWYKEDSPTLSQMEQYLSNVDALRSVFELQEYAPQTPKSMALLTFAKANDIERILQYVETTIQQTVKGMARSNSFTFWSGNRAFPTADSSRGRNWGELDAMNTGWRNWQLATWYLLLYGNLKAEGDVV